MEKQLSSRLLQAICRAEEPLALFPRDGKSLRAVPRNERLSKSELATGIQKVLSILHYRLEALLQFQEGGKCKITPRGVLLLLFLLFTLVSFSGRPSRQALAWLRSLIYLHAENYSQALRASHIRKLEKKCLTHVSCFDLLDLFFVCFEGCKVCHGFLSSASEVWLCADPFFGLRCCATICMSMATSIGGLCTGPPQAGGKCHGRPVHCSGDHV